MNRERTPIPATLPVAYSLPVPYLVDDWSRSAYHNYFEGRCQIMEAIVKRHDEAGEFHAAGETIFTLRIGCPHSEAYFSYYLKPDEVVVCGFGWQISNTKNFLYIGYLVREARGIVPVSSNSLMSADEVY